MPPWCIDHEGALYPLRRVAIMAKEIAKSSTSLNQKRREALIERLGFTKVARDEAAPTPRSAEFHWEIPESHQESVRPDQSAWSTTDLLEAVQVYRLVLDDTAGAILDYLIDHPGRHSATEIAAALGLASETRSVAATFSSWSQKCKQVGKAFGIEFSDDPVPTYWLARPLAKLFAKARECARAGDLVTIMPEKGAFDQWKRHGLYLCRVSTRKDLVIDFVGFVQEGTILPEIARVAWSRRDVTIEELEKTEGSEAADRLEDVRKAATESKLDRFNLVALSRELAHVLSTPIADDQRALWGHPAVVALSELVDADASVASNLVLLA